MKTVMQHSFAEISSPEIPRSSFNLSHGYKTTWDADGLVPFLCMDVIPSDTISLNATQFTRLATPLHPLMDNIYIDTFYFFVPYRLLWDNWERFMGAQDDPTDSIDFTIPIVTGASAGALGDNFDYLGLPLDWVPDNEDVSCLPFRALRKIWNEWFRNENLQDSLAVQTDNGPDNNTECGWADVPLKRCKKRDYLTSCLPWPQKGDAVDLPLGLSAPIYATVAEDVAIQIGDDGQAVTGIPKTAGATLLVGTDTANTYPDDVNLRADLTNATTATINDFRLAMQTQALLERDARAGTRYVETLLAHWGVTVPDFRLQRSEFLNGSSIPMNITPVANTSGTASEDQGHLTGFGTSSGKSGFTKSFVEHGVIIGLINARSDITYTQGVDRYWSKSTRYDFYYPLLSGIGEQSVLNKEIWSNPAGTNNDDVFGYQERYSEYRFMNSRLTNLMRPDAAGTLASWNLSEDFASLPTLGATFIESNTSTPLDRAIADSSEPQFITDMYIKIKAARPMPLHGTPFQLAHF